jgi:hypothetical protein
LLDLPAEEDVMEDDRKKNFDVERETNEGEGSKSADQAYRRNVGEFLEHEDPARLGREAASDIERDPESYEAAERAGKERIAEEDEADKDLI